MADLKCPEPYITDERGAVKTIGLPTCDLCGSDDCGRPYRLWLERSAPGSKMEVVDSPHVEAIMRLLKDFDACAAVVLLRQNDGTVGLAHFIPLDDAFLLGVQEGLDTAIRHAAGGKLVKVVAPQVIKRPGKDSD